MKIKEIISVGNGLELVGIPDKSIMFVEETLIPKVGDLVVCRRMSGSLNRYVLQVLKKGRGRIVVGSRYKEQFKNFTFEPAEICAVVIQAIDVNQNIVYTLRR